MRSVRQCFKCKEKFRIEELVGYASPRAVTEQYYCSKCLKEKQEQDIFSDKVCEIFGLKNPGPRIWKERKTLQEKYGYTDSLIIDCLDYIYNVKKYKKLSESLTLVRPSIVAEMKKYKNSEQGKVGSIIAAMMKPVEYIQVKIQENNNSVEEEEDFDQFFNN